MFKNLKRKWNRYLERMAAANEKSFGGQRLDCCTMDRSTQPHNHATQVKPSQK